jgi:hypothetical protein
MDNKCAKRARLDAEGRAGARAADTGGGADASDDEALFPLFSGAATDNETRIPLGEEDHEDEEGSEVCNNTTNF